MIHKLVVVSPEPVSVFKEYAGCSLTLVNRQLRAESLPYYLQSNTFHLDRCTDIGHWVESIGEKSLMAWVRTLIVDVNGTDDEGEKEVVHRQDILIRPIHASDMDNPDTNLPGAGKEETGIFVQHLGTHERGYDCTATAKTILRWQPTLMDLLRIANNIMWYGEACNLIRPIGCRGDLYAYVFRGIPVNAVEDAPKAFRRFVKGWTVNYKPLVRKELRDLAEEAAEHRRSIRESKERIAEIKERLRYAVDE